MWTEAVSRKKMLRFQKYPDRCGQGLRLCELCHPDCVLAGNARIIVGCFAKQDETRSSIYISRDWLQQF